MSSSGNEISSSHMVKTWLEMRCHSSHLVAERPGWVGCASLSLEFREDFLA